MLLQERLQHDVVEGVTTHFGSPSRFSLSNPGFAESGGAAAATTGEFGRSQSTQQHQQQKWMNEPLF